MAADQFLGQFDALGMGGATGHGAGINRKQIAARGGDITTAVRAACGASIYAPTVESSDQTVHFACRLAVDMQTVAVLAFFDIADKAVNAGNRLGGAGINGKAQILGHA